MNSSPDYVIGKYHSENNNTLKITFKIPFERDINDRCNSEQL